MQDNTMWGKHLNLDMAGCNENTSKKETSDSTIAREDPIESLLNELNEAFFLFQDGVINDDTFVGGSPLSYLNTDGTLGTLTLEESREIKKALMEPSAQPDKTLVLFLRSLINWMPFFQENDNEKQTGNNGQEPTAAIIGSNGRFLPLPKNANLNLLVESRLKAQGLEHLGAYWYAISEALETKSREEVCGDLVLIDDNRRMLSTRRLNATPFERAAQSFSEHISFLFCDDNGDIISPESLELFIKRLIQDLLRRTKQYWPIAPLLSLFDAIVAPVLRPMVYPHQTWASEHNFFSEGGAYDVGQLANKRTSLETIPLWNDSAKQQVIVYVEQALKHHLSSRLLGLQVLDAFSPYNREINSSEHVDLAKFRGKIKSFGPPVHVQEVMQLIQPTPKKPEEKVLEKVMTYRSLEDGVWY